MGAYVSWRNCNGQEGTGQQGGAEEEEPERVFPRPRLIEQASFDEGGTRLDTAGRDWRSDDPRRPPSPPDRRRPTAGAALTVSPGDPVIDRLAQSRLSVIVVGETGAGKELLARRLHDRSPRARGPFLAVNAAAVCESLIDSELFGYERGAFTGAVKAKVGLIEAAEGGTLFLDEIAELPLGAQAKLLRVLETRTVTRVGGVNARPVDVRVIAATNRNLHEAVADGRFREDLLFRLEGIALHLAPLRDRAPEILPAARAFIAEQAAREGRTAAALTESAERALLDYDWPGNFRELRNVIERAAVICAGGRIEPADLLLPVRADAHDPTLGTGRLPWPDAGAAGAFAPQSPLRASSKHSDERQRVVAVLSMCGGNQTRAARLLGISRRTLISQIQKLGIVRPRMRLRVVADPRAAPQPGGNP